MRAADGRQHLVRVRVKVRVRVRARVRVRVRVRLLMSATVQGAKPPQYMYTRSGSIF